jgi:hypothetical protein
MLLTQTQGLKISAQLDLALQEPEGQLDVIAPHTNNRVIFHSSVKKNRGRFFCFHILSDAFTPEKGGHILCHNAMTI